MRDNRDIFAIIGRALKSVRPALKTRVFVGPIERAFYADTEGGFIAGGFIAGGADAAKAHLGFDRENEVRLSAPMLSMFFAPKDNRPIIVKVKDDLSPFGIMPGHPSDLHKFAGLKAMMRRQRGAEIWSCRWPDGNSFFSADLLEGWLPAPLEPNANIGPQEVTTSNIVSDAEVKLVHAKSWFGSMPARQVVDEGVLKAAFGYSSGQTQIEILRQHGLIYEQQNQHRNVLTERGYRYLRALVSFSQLSEKIRKDAGDGGL